MTPTIESRLREALKLLREARSEIQIVAADATLVITDWIKTHDGTQLRGMAYAFECQRCGTIQKVETPIDVTLYVALSKAFIRQHRGCQPPEGVKA